MSSIDRRTVDSFGEEWSAFDQSGASAAELEAIWRTYFSVVPDSVLSADRSATVRAIDVGCGSGRWAAFVAPLVDELWCVDPSPQALAVAAARLAGDASNVRLAVAAAGALPFPSASFDFAYSLGVLHHTPDTAAAMADCVRLLRPGGAMLVYLYYALDDRPVWFRALWRASDVVRRWMSGRRPATKRRLANAIGVGVYWPLARTARLVGRVAGGSAAERLPLALYRDKSLYVMRNDALDRFGTPLEQRFTREQIEAMMAAAGLERIVFSPDPPFWCALGYRRAAT